MKEKKQTILLRKLIEAGNIGPAPGKMEFFVPHYEVTVGIGKDYTATIIIDADSYFELLENDDYAD